MKNHTIFLLLIAALAVCGCTAGEEYIFEQYGKTIGAGGGKYEGVDKVTVIVPKNVLEKDITFLIYSLDTPAFTAVSATVTNIYTLSPGAYRFKAPITVVIPYNEENLPPLMDENYLRPYFATDRDHFTEIKKEDFELDAENNVVRINTQFLGNFHIGLPKDMVKKDNGEAVGVSEMVYIPVGFADYGAPVGTPTGLKSTDVGLKTSEGLNRVYLSAYYIDKYEVSNGQYKLCVNAEVCTEPYNVSSSKYPNYYNDPAYSNFPVIWVSWNQANTFCQWAGKMLPSEAQWEKAARGETYQKYPWGETDPQDNAENSIVNYSALFDDVTDVSAFDKAVSPYNIFNMSGNVAEWTNNWYDIDSYYKVFSTEDDPALDPSGPSETAAGAVPTKIIKGGSWVSLKDEITTYARDNGHPHYRYYNVGFRCVKGAQ